jgi:hypothetical protein
MVIGELLKSIAMAARQIMRRTSVGKEGKRGNEVRGA